MKNILLLAAVFLALSGCGLIQRADEVEEASGEKNLTVMENELARLNSKVEALETKLEVVTNALEKERLKSTQPAIHAQEAPKPIEVDTASQPPARAVQDTHRTMSAVPVKAAAAAPSPAERDFQRGMELFQNGRNLEAAGVFADTARKYDQHPLAAHALYWAGEANARNRQWTLAIENWEEIERAHNRSAYVPDALAGLARAYDAQGNAQKASQYRNLVARAFPNSPVALSALTSSDAPAAAVEDSPAPATTETEEESE